MNSTADLYLKRLGVEAEPPSAEALARLHRAHVERVPYDTFWIHLAQGWGIDPVECAQRIATTRRGGYCFQLNSAFHTLLTELGYQVSLNVAGVYLESGPDKDTLLNHTTIIAEGLPSDTSPSGRWWVDVGLGDALYDPVPLVQGAYTQGPMRFGMEAVEPEGPGDWRLTHDPSGWVTGVILVDQPVEMNVFAKRHHFNATSPESGYAKVITAQRRHAEGVTLMRGCVLTHANGSDVTKHTCESLPEWVDVLESEFDLSFDDVPDEAMAALWTSVRRTHDEWLASRQSA
ncbi:arylamine N-acetyltransferase family protein [Streptomyces sp. NPDC055506]